MKAISPVGLEREEPLEPRIRAQATNAPSVMPSRTNDSAAASPASRCVMLSSISIDTMTSVRPPSSAGVM